MAKIKLTKGELKRQRDSLAQFQHYLPTLQLKKKQLQIKINELQKRLEDKQAQLDRQDAFVRSWAGLLADPALAASGAEFTAENLKEDALPQDIVTDVDNIAGAEIPVLRDVVFKELAYDYYSTPFWVDRGLKGLRALMTVLIEVSIMKSQAERLRHELRVTTQRVNLFEKVKIPECQDNIRKITIYLGDQQANAVGISKVAKKKIGELAVV